MIAILFITCCALTLLHFVYEGTVAPSLRYAIRLKLFAVRDKVRWEKISAPDSIDDELFNSIEGSISTAISVLPHITIPLVERINRDCEAVADWKQDSDERLQRMQNHPSETLRQAWREMGRLLVCGLLVNHGIWALIVIPLVVFNIAMASITRSVWRLLVAPPKEIEQITHCDDQLGLA